MALKCLEAESNISCFRRERLDLYLLDLGLYRIENLIYCFYEFSWNDGCHPPSSHVLELVVASKIQ